MVVLNMRRCGGLNMKNFEYSIEEIFDLITKTFEENEIVDVNLKMKDIESIIINTEYLCSQFRWISEEELDIFKKAAGLLVAVHSEKLLKDNRDNAFIAIDVAYKFCEQEYLSNEKIELADKIKNVDIQTVLKENKDEFISLKNEMIDSLIGKIEAPWNYHFALRGYCLSILLEKYRMINNLSLGKYKRDDICEVKEEKNTKIKVLKYVKDNEE